MSWQDLKRLRISTLAGAGIALLGFWWLIPTLTVLVGGMLRVGARISLALDMAFLLTMGTLMTLPGACAAYFGFKLFRETSAKNIRRASGSLAFLAGFLFAVALSGSSLPLLEATTSISTLLATVFGILLYVVLARLLLRKEGIAITGVQGLVGRGLVFLVSIQIFLAGADITRVYAPLREDMARDLTSLWALLGIFYSALLAWAVHRVALKLLKIDSRTSPTFSLRDGNGSGERPSPESGG